MVMIRCPNCGQRALDIATTCPQCHSILIQNPLETHNWGTLRECGRCHKHIERGADVCPYCGHRVRATRLAARSVAAVAGLAVLAAAGVAAWRSGVVDSLRGALGANRPAPEAAAPVIDPAPVLPPPAGAAEVVVAPITAAGPAEPPPPGAVAAAAPAPAFGLVTRWTGEWANVRSARDTTSEVVRVLAPNVAIEVGDMRRGWWALYVGGAFVGYIANSVLRTDPAQP
jgi:RNA polymerase subunit RPABC4/transcription elongation factor Spt4